MGRHRAVRRELCFPGQPRALALYRDYAGGETAEHRGGNDAVGWAKGAKRRVPTIPPTRKRRWARFRLRSASDGRSFAHPITVDPPRHCERSEVIHSAARQVWIASLLAHLRGLVAPPQAAA